MHAYIAQAMGNSGNVGATCSCSNPVHLAAAQFLGTGHQCFGFGKYLITTDSAVGCSKERSYDGESLQANVQWPLSLLPAVFKKNSSLLLSITNYNNIHVNELVIYRHLSSPSPPNTKPGTVEHI